MHPAITEAIVYLYTRELCMTAREAINRLRREGWSERPGKGSHMIFKRDGRRVVISNHGGDIPTGTLRAICAQAGWPFPPER